MNDKMHLSALPIFGTYGSDWYSKLCYLREIEEALCGILYHSMRLCFQVKQVQLANELTIFERKKSFHKETNLVINLLALGYSA